MVMMVWAGKISAQNLSVPDTIQNSKFKINSVEGFAVQDSERSLSDTTINPQLKKDPVLAWLISFPVGVLGLHRAYLGTSARTVFLYIVTAGGFFGIVPMVDWILLMKGIQNNDISKYEGNRKFIMWL